MTEPVKRSYDSTKRQAQARRTRARIRDAAAQLFVERGYAATSIAAVAERADVSTQTIFSTFGGKANLLSEAIDVALAGDDEPIAVADRPEMRETELASTAAAAAATLATFTTRIMTRAGLLLRAAEAAADQDPDLRQRWLDGHLGRLGDMRRVATGFAAAGFLREGLGVEDAAELLWAFGDPAVYCSFRLIRRFTDAQYEDWLRRTVTISLFGTAVEDDDGSLVDPAHHHPLEPFA